MSSYLSDVREIVASAKREARKCWNGACEPNWSLIDKQVKAFRDAFRAEWGSLSVYGLHSAGENAYGTPFKVDIETGRALI